MDVAQAQAARHHNLRVGDFVDAKDHVQGPWREAVVTAMTQHTVTVHFRGHPKRDKKSFPVTSPLLASAYTHVAKWREFSVGDGVQLGTASHKEVKVLWQVAVVDKVSKKNHRIRVRAHDGEVRWLDPESEFLCQPETHKVFISSAPMEDVVPEEVDDGAEEEEVCVGDLASSLWRSTVAAGTALEAHDSASGWFEARVVSRDGDLVCVRFRGWPWTYDKWYRVTDRQLAPAETHFGPWRRGFKDGSPFQIGFRESECMDQASHWVVGTSVKIRQTSGQTASDPGSSQTTQEVTMVQVEFAAPDGNIKTEWRDPEDDFLAPAGALTYPGQAKCKKTKSVLQGGDSGATKSNETKETTESQEAQKVKDTKQAKEAKQDKTAKQVQTVKQAKKAWGVKDCEDAKETKGTEEFKKEAEASDTEPRQDRTKRRRIADRMATSSAPEDLQSQSDSCASTPTPPSSDQLQLLLDEFDEFTRGHRERLQSLRDGFDEQKRRIHQQLRLAIEVSEGATPTEKRPKKRPRQG